MRFLLTNDDGIDGPGLHASERLVSAFGNAVVIAPLDQLSGCGHQATHRRPMPLHERGLGRYALEGFPADCVRVGTYAVAKETDWVISGINPGGNLGADVYMSGTVAAAREAAYLGKKAIAISALLAQGYEIDWDRMAAVLKPIVADLLARPLAPKHFWNLNLPCLPEGDEPIEVVECPVDDCAMDLRYEFADGAYHWKGVYRDRPRTPGSDFAVCQGGRAALSLIRL